METLLYAILCVNVLGNFIHYFHFNVTYDVYLILTLEKVG